MKHLLIGLLVIGSFSSFANECEILLKSNDLQEVQIETLRGKGYTPVIVDEFTSDHVNKLALRVDTSLKKSVSETLEDIREMRRKSQNGEEVGELNIFEIKYQVMLLGNYQKVDTKQFELEGESYEKIEYVTSKLKKNIIKLDSCALIIKKLSRREIFEGKLFGEQIPPENQNRRGTLFL